MQAVVGVYQTANQRLGGFLDPANHRTIFSDLDFQQISSALQACDRRSWSLVSRLYTVLRIVGQLQLLDNFINEGITRLVNKSVTISVSQSVTISVSQSVKGFLAISYALE
jgi:hypothetical protein